VGHSKRNLEKEPGDVHHVAEEFRGARGPEGTDGKYPNCPVAAADVRQQSKEQSLVDLDLAAFEFLSQPQNREPMKPLLAVAGVVANDAPVNAQKACETVHAQFAMEECPERVARTAHPSSVLKGIIAASPAPSLSGSLNLDIVL
jgi:hypothetical protein